MFARRTLSLAVLALVAAVPVAAFAAPFGPMFGPGPKAAPGAPITPQ